MSTYYDGWQERLGIWLLCLPHIWPWYTQKIYMGHTMKKKETGWLLTVRFKRGSVRTVVFVEGDTPSDCVKDLATRVVQETLTYHEDRFA
jgi:hypothetical protein